MMSCTRQLLLVLLAITGTPGTTAQNSLLSDDFRTNLNDSFNMPNPDSSLPSGNFETIVLGADELMRRSKEMDQMSNQTLLSPISSLSLLNFQVRPQVLSDGARSLRNIEQLIERFRSGALDSASIQETVHPLAIAARSNTGNLPPNMCQGRPDRRCSSSLYPSMDGSCNNPHNTAWGKANSPLIRIVRNNYEDGIFSPRHLSVSGRRLPRPRRLSVRCMQVGDGRPSSVHTLFVMQLGQFLDHDLVHVPIQRDGERWPSWDIRDSCNGRSHIRECPPILATFSALRNPTSIIHFTDNVDIRCKSDVYSLSYAYDTDIICETRTLDGPENELLEKYTPSIEGSRRSTAGNGNGLECCESRHRRLRACRLAIKISSKDPLYSKSRIRCMNFVRSIPFASFSDQAAQQVNQITHFIDASNVYGSSDDELNELRETNSYLMKTSGDRQLPLDEDRHLCEVRRRSRRDRCFTAGDSRVNEQPSLTLTHTKWVQMHNIVARELRRLNPAASAEQVFQETRLVIIAMMQKIYYRDWLPLIIGGDLVREFGLILRDNYNCTINPGIIQEFSTAAFRFGHSLVSGRVQTMKDFSRSGTTSFQLSKLFFRPFTQLRNRARETSLVRGLCSQPIQNMDNTFTQELAGKLFRGRKRLGMDLVSLSIQRGRDHAIATYAQTRSLFAGVCNGVSVVRDWSDLNGVMSEQNIKALRESYRSVLDVDLFVGGVMEIPLDGLVGPTFACIMAEQFSRLKKADRFFYNHRNSLLSDEQIAAIDKVTWSSILCATSDIDEVPQNAFLIRSSSNRVVPCSDIVRPSLAKWTRILPRS